nr:ScpA family protein [Alloalcanivorax profundimaris]
MPFGLMYGQAITKLPDDLYIPPDALEVFLEAFEGPLDLLLYLIKRQNLDILDIPVAQITSQYMEYVELMKALNLELAAEYLVMAAMLGEIKSRTLLPRPSHDDEEDGEDPRAELIRRLQEYERFKQAAEDIDALPRQERDFQMAAARRPEYVREKAQPDVDLRELLLAFKEVLHRADMFESHQVSREKLSTRERMANVLDRLKGRDFVPFVELFEAEEGRLGVVVSFLAVLELVKGSLIELIQNEPFSPIHVKAKTLVLEESEALAALEIDDEPSTDTAEDD